MDRLRTERHPRIWHNGGLESDGVKVWLIRSRRVDGCSWQHRRGKTSPGEERDKKTGKKVVIAHESVEFGEATVIGLADESKESLHGRETNRDLRST